MEIIRFLPILLTLQIINPSESTRVDCTYTFHHYDVMGSIYQCKVEGYLSISTKEQATITSVSAIHSHLQNNNDVNGFVADFKSLDYFPQGLDKFFKNIQLLRIRYSSIKEVTQTDFKPFPQLKELDMHENKISILEDGLFDFNPRLVFVSFSKNKLFRIEPKVFDKLSNLQYLYLTSNECIDTHANNNRELVEMVIGMAKTNCNLKDESSTISPDALVQVSTFAPDEPGFEEDLSYDEDIPARENYRSSGRSSTLQIMFIIIFLLAIAAAGGVFYFLSAYGYQF